MSNPFQTTLGIGIKQEGSDYDLMIEFNMKTISINDNTNQKYNMGSIYGIGLGLMLK